MAQMTIACAFKCPLLDTILSDVDVHLPGCWRFIPRVHHEGDRIKSHITRDFNPQAGVNCACGQGDRHLGLAIGEGVHVAASGICCRRNHGHRLENKKKNEKKWACSASIVHGVHRPGLDGCPSSSLRRSKGSLAKIDTVS